MTRRRPMHSNPPSALERRVARAQWRELADRALRAAANPARADGELARLGALSRTWRWPAPPAEGAMVMLLSGAAHAYGWQTNETVRRVLAPELRRAAEHIITLLDVLERGDPAGTGTPEPDPEPETPAVRLPYADT